MYDVNIKSADGSNQYEETETESGATWHVVNAIHQGAESGNKVTSFRISQGGETVFEADL